MSDVQMADRVPSTAPSDRTLPDRDSRDPAAPIKLTLGIAAVIAVGLLACNLLAFLG